MALVGVGDLGHAIADYRGFKARGFRIAALFDADPVKVGERIGDLTILPMEQLSAEIRHLGIRIAMIAVPAAEAQAVADRLIEAGVTALLNYAPITRAVPVGVRVQYIDPAAHLQHMTYYLAP